MEQEKLIGIITKDADVFLENGRIFGISQRGTDKEGYPEVLIDARLVGGDGWMHRQSIKPYIGMKCSFYTNNGRHGFNFEIIPDSPSIIEISFTQADVRNKLSPFKNLIAMLENGLVKGTIEVHPYILKEIEQCKKSIEYLSGDKTENHDN